MSGGADLKKAHADIDGNPVDDCRSWFAVTAEKRDVEYTIVDHVGLVDAELEFKRVWPKVYLGVR